MTKPYDATQPDRSAVDAMPGVVAVDFGTNWCGYCQAAQGYIAEALQDYPQVKHVKAEDGPGRPLGVKPWSIPDSDQPLSTKRVASPGQTVRVKST